ncbi:hypothetical protein [Cellulomonas sp. P5_E12]
MRKVLVAALTAVSALLGALVIPTSAASAADNALFEPGLIISDPIFYDYRSMTDADIQNFLTVNGAGCVPASDGTACVKDYHMATASRPSDGRCPLDYTGAADESAAQVISKVATACAINPRVLLVKLQVEQSMINRKTAGTAGVYQKAMGFACPDTAPCDALYYGFFNQVYSAASQFQRYRLSPKSYRFQTGQVNQIGYHPNADCGSSAVTIQSQATAGLYNYTPYQPNAAALAAGAGIGDPCSSYGNRNFWRFFTDWFGSTTQRAPVGAVDSISGSAFGVVLSGWALDKDTTNPIQVHVYVDGVGTPWVADQARADIDAAFGRGARHGFSGTVPASAGTHSVCVYAIDATGGSNTTLRCATVTVTNQAPFGSIDTLSTSPGQITVAGWAVDRDTDAPIQTHVYVDGVGSPWLANGNRPDVGAMFGVGSNHGFGGTVNASPGDHNVCVYAINVPSGPNTTLTCTQVRVPSAANAAPTGALDQLAGTPQGIALSGWALDPDTTNPIQVHVYVDGVGTPWLANGSRPDVAAAFGKGDTHGFSGLVSVPGGTHSVCVYAIDSGGGPNTVLRCANVTVTNAPPIGAVDTLSSTTGGIAVGGWTLDPDTSDPIQVHVYVDGVGTPWLADGSRPDVAAAFGKGDRHGFSGTVAATAGTHNVCFYAINVPGGPNTVLACRSVTVAG